MNSLSESRWGIDPLFWAAAKLFIRDLYNALPTSSTSVYLIGNGRAFRTAEIIGIVVSVDMHGSKARVYTLDDGTGVIPCVNFLSPEEQEDVAVRDSMTHSLGATVCVQGRMSMFRGRREIIANSVTEMNENAEMLGWLERISIHKYLEAPPPQ